MTLFKIDLAQTSRALPFGLFAERVGWFSNWWEEIDTFKTRDEAKAYHEKIRDLPEYLFPTTIK